MRIRTNVIILGILFISAYAGNYLGLGDRFWWLDVALHFLGGFFIAVLIREFYEYLVWTFFDRFPQWDLFNIGFDLPDYFDALSDLLMDLLGTIALVLLNKKSD